MLEAVRELIAPVEDLDSRPCARRMSALLDPDTPRSPEPFRVLEDLRQTVLEAAAAGPLLLVLEDMHWAGRSTQDFAVALSRRARGRLLFVLTVRTDDLHRRHPARRTLAEIGRFPGARHLDLAPLDPASIAGIVESHAGTGADAGLVRSVLDRSEGNPLYAEELAAADPQAIPEQLSDLFLARVDALAEGPRELLRVASVDGTRVDTDTLAELTGRRPGGAGRVPPRAARREPPEGTRAARWCSGTGCSARPCTTTCSPTSEPGSMPGSPRLLQERIDQDPDPRLSALSRLAFHWSAAHDLPHTLEASVRAGEVASRIGAAEAVTHRERALSLWDRVPDAEARAGCTHVELLLGVGQGGLRPG